MVMSLFWKKSPRIGILFGQYILNLESLHSLLNSFLVIDGILGITREIILWFMTLPKIYETQKMLSDFATSRLGSMQGTAKGRLPPKVVVHQKSSSNIG